MYFSNVLKINNKDTSMSLLLTSSDKYPCISFLQLVVLEILEIPKKFIFRKAARRCPATILQIELQQGRTFRTVASKSTSGGLFLVEWIQHDIKFLSSSSCKQAISVDRMEA